MTSIVALRCRDGVVIGADSAVTLGAAGGQISTIEQLSSKKIRLIDSSIILAGSGQQGLMQRFHAKVKSALSDGTLSSTMNGIEFGKTLSRLGIEDFRETHLQDCDFSAYIGFMASGEAFLCELDGSSGFQPEIKELSDLWYVSGGQGQSITDPFLALLSEAFWADGPPSLKGGIFTALWTLKHVCKLNVGGVGYPINLAALSQDTGNARMLSLDELAEHDNVVEAAMRHLGDFRDVLEGKASAEAVPHPVQ